MVTSSFETLRDRASENYIPESDLVTLKQVGEGAFAVGALIRSVWSFCDSFVP